MKVLAFAWMVAAAAMISMPAHARDLPAGGMTVEDVVNWLQSEGFQAKVVTEKNGKQTITSSTGGTNFHIGFYDCKGTRCGSIQFFAGFDTKGAFNPTKMNQWDRAQRWGRAYVDNVNDPWLEMDVDLTPGGTYELLDDEFATWRSLLTHFRQFLGV